MDNFHYATIQEYLFQMLDSVVPRGSAAYVAGPLESGREYYYLMSTGQYEKGSIRPKNQEKLTAFANLLRKKIQCPVIDPGVLHVSSWEGKDYGLFFIDVIKHYAKEVWFLNEWEYSGGATKEFQFCSIHNIRCLDEKGELLSPMSGKMLIKDAICYVEKLKLDSTRLKSRLQF
jgi:hypothetical protein